jgi:Leucine-rich repeat (LRR) protein
LKYLKYFSLKDNILTEFPESFRQLVCLETLTVHYERLKCLPKSFGDLKMLQLLELSHCDNLKKLPKNLGALTNLQYLKVSFCPIKRLPKSIGLLWRLWKLEIRACKKLQKLPTSIRQLKSLREFILDSCGSIEAMGALTTLQGFPIWGSTSITKLPTSLGIVSTLEAYYKKKCLGYCHPFRLCDACFEGTI